MEFTHSLLPQLLNSKIHKLPDPVIESKVAKLKKLAPPLDKLLGHKAVTRNRFGRLSRFCDL